MTLKIARSFSLPVETVAQSLGILAMRGAGKSNTAVVMAEEMYDNHIPWVAIDPKGDWFGIRSSKDGKYSGLAIPVFGGLHGDVPLHADNGQQLADLLIDSRLTCVVDVSEFSKGEQTRFLVDLADRLFRRQRRNPEPMHLFLEEAHEYLPQRVMRDQAVLVGLWSRIVKQGRSFGLGVTVISQRSASLNKDVLTQIGTLIVMRTLSPQDRKAISDWVSEYDVDKAMLPSLPTLEDGEAWIWSPQFLKEFKRVKFRQRRTFDSGATPKLGQVRKPTTLADIDLDAIQEKWAESIERAKEEDPRELKKEIQKLRRELADRNVHVEQVEVEVRVPTPYVPEYVVSVVKKVGDELGQLRHFLSKYPTKVDEEEKVARSEPDIATKNQSSTRPERTSPRVASGPSDPSLGAMETKLLTVLVQHGGVSQDKLLVLSGYRAGGSYYRAMKNLRDNEYVNKGAPITATQAGVNALGQVSHLPSGQELFEYWLDQFGGMEKVILDVLKRYEKGLSQDDLLHLTGYKVGGSYYRAMKKLRSAGLVNKGAPIKLSSEFREAIS